MAALDKTMGQVPGGGTRRTYGTALFDGSKWYAKVGGNLLTARWLDPVQPQQGGKIIVDITDDGHGQSTALVVGAYTDQPRPGTGAVLAIGVTDIVVAGDDGSTYTTDSYTGSYSVGNFVKLSWSAGKPTIHGVVARLAVTPAAGLQPQPSVKASGETTLVATASGTFGAGRWGLAVASERRNAVSNPKLAADSVGWSGAGGTFARVATGGPAGFPAFAQTTATGAPAFIDAINQGAGLNLVTPGKVYTQSGQVRGSVAGTIRIYVQFLDAAGATLSTAQSSAIVNTPGVFAPFTLTTAAAPAGAVRARLIYRLLGTIPAGATVGATAAMLADVPGAYFDGDTAATASGNTITTRAWSGAANASPSTEAVLGLVATENVSTGATAAGAWFYGVPKPELAGKTITGIRFRLPRRLSTGAGGTATIHFYAHTSQSRPAGDVTRTVGPFDVDVAQDSPGQWVDLPLTFAPVLAAGGGISIKGSPSAGFTSRLDDPQSGLLVLKWSS
jgi:hypothetical protein